mgnify:FL=1|jgi:hypothetical protein
MSLTNNKLLPPYNPDFADKYIKASPETFRKEYMGDFLTSGRLKGPEVESFDRNDKSVKHSLLVEEIFDNVSIYLHITVDPDGVDSTRHSRVTISSIPFTDPEWGNRLHHICLGSEFPKLMDVQSNEKKSYELHRKLLIELAYILTLRGHEVFTCFVRNPTPDNTLEYTHFSEKLREEISNKKERETINASSSNT